MACREALQPQVLQQEGVGVQSEEAHKICRLRSDLDMLLTDL